MLNHSCEPNAEIKYPSNNHEVSIILTRDVKKGEEIEIRWEIKLNSSYHYQVFSFCQRGNINNSSIIFIKITFVCIKYHQADKQV